MIIHNSKYKHKQKTYFIVYTLNRKYWINKTKIHNNIISQDVGKLFNSITDNTTQISSIYTSNLGFLININMPFSPNENKKCPSFEHVMK